MLRETPHQESFNKTPDSDRFSLGTAAEWGKRVIVAALLLCGGCKSDTVLGPLESESVDYYTAVAETADGGQGHWNAHNHPDHTPPPRTLDEENMPEYWDLTLSQAIHTALTNSDVLRDLGGTILRAPEAKQTYHNVPIVETDPRFGMEAALSQFDSQFTTTAIFEKNDRTLNNQFFGGGTRTLEQDINFYETELTKQTATGTELTFLSTIDYDANNAPGNQFGSAWNSLFDAEIRQPLLQGNGLEFNRIAGPESEPGVYNGFLIARVNSEISEVEFEVGLRDFISDVTNAYWDLYFAYRDLEAAIVGRDAALKTWQRIKNLQEQERRGGEADKEALAREQYYRFKLAVENMLAGRLQEGTQSQSGQTGGTFRRNSGVLVAERRLRLLMGLPVTDARLIRPSDEPEKAEVLYNWETLVQEAMMRRPELRRQDLKVQRLEMELIAAENFLKPRLDVVGRYRWRGFGKDLLPQGDRNKFLPAVDDEAPELNDNRAAIQDVFNGDFQEWQLGVEFSMPIGFRQAHAAVQNAELKLARARSILQEQRRQVVHDLSNAQAEVRRAYKTAQTALNRYLSADELLTALEAIRDEGRPVDLDRLLDAQRRRAESQSQYFSAMVAYTLALKNLNIEKGSLMEYCGLRMHDDVLPENATVNMPAADDQPTEDHGAENQVLLNEVPEVDAQ